MTLNNVDNYDEFNEGICGIFKFRILHKKFDKKLV